MQVSVMRVTEHAAWKHAAPSPFYCCSPRCSPGLPSAARNPLHSEFCRDAGRCVCGGRCRSPLEILDLRHFSSVDLRPLLEDETQVWSRLLSWDYSGSAEMILRYVDAKILPGYAAVDRGRVFGYSFFVYEGSKGVIGDLYVINGSRLPNAREVELKLLTHVIETLQQSPGIHRVEAQLLAHEANAVSRPFLETGFQRHPRLFMVLPLGKPSAAKMSGASGSRNPALDRSRLPAVSRRDHGGLSRPCRRPDQRPVPHSERVAALSEQHRALSRDAACSTPSRRLWPWIAGRRD